MRDAPPCPAPLPALLAMGIDVPSGFVRAIAGPVDPEWEAA